ncbi:MAG: hypothetical protein WAY93_06655, partial [Atopobiaceae bacterium]
MGRRRKGSRSARMRRASSGPRKPGKAITGVLHVARPGSATVETAEGTFLVARGGIREGMNGDTVSVTLSRRGP